MAHEIAVGTKVRVRFQAGWFNDHFYRSGWRVGTVTGHSTIGEARVPGGFPRYDVTLRDGNVVRYCAPECVRAIAESRRGPGPEAGALVAELSYERAHERALWAWRNGR